MRDMEDKHWWFASRREILKSVLQQGLKLTKMNNGCLKLMEIGCGSGANFPVLSGYGELHGVDISETMVACASKKCLANSVSIGSLPCNLGITEISEFDLIFCGDVLEHVKEDVSSLVSIRERLRRGGILIIFVPAFSWLWSENDVRSHHYRRYSRTYLSTILESAGFKIKRMSYFNSLLFVPIFLAQKIKSFFKLSFDEVAFRPGFLNNMLRYIFSSEAFWLKHVNFPVGYSLMAIAVKN